MTSGIGERSKLFAGLVKHILVLDVDAQVLSLQTLCKKSKERVRLYFTVAHYLDLYRPQRSVIFRLKVL